MPSKQMTENEVEQAAHADPDARPLTDAELRKARRVPIARRVRWRTGLTQAQFAKAYEIPLGTLRDWEQGLSEPDSAARAYLKVIDRDAGVVQRLLQPAD
jgi:putative transcriptional regulator